MISMVAPRKLILLVLLLATLILTLSVTAAVMIRESATPEATVHVSPSNITVRVDQIFEVTIGVSAVSDLYGWEFKLGYNNNLLEVVNFAEGRFLNSSRDTYFVPKNVSTDGYVLAGCTSLTNVAGVSGNGTLATVEFHAKALGSCALDLYDTKLVDSAKQLMDHSEVDGIVTASGSVTIRVQYLDGASRSGADVRKIDPPITILGTTDQNGLVTSSGVLGGPRDYLIDAWWNAHQFGGNTPMHVDSNGDGSATITAFYEITLPTITVLSPQNLTYTNSSVPLTFAVYDYSPISWIGYSLDKQANTTITGNTIISVGNGAHGIVVYANDTFGNMGSSQMVCFTANSSLYEPWETSFIGLDSYPIVDFAVYNGSLYAAADNKLYAYDGSSWNVIDAPTFVTSLEPYGGKLVVGGQGGLYCYDGTSFSLIFSVPTYIKALGAYNDTLYAGAMLDNPPELYYCNGPPENPVNWHVDTGFSTILNFSGAFGSIDSFAVYDGKMYVASGNTVYCFDGTGWSVALSYEYAYAFLDMQVYNGKLYLATRDLNRIPLYMGGTGFSGTLIEYDGGNWTTILGHDYWLYSLEVYDGKLYVGTANRIYTYNGTAWDVSFYAENGAFYAISMITYNDKIYAGIGNGYIFADPAPAKANPETIVVPEFHQT